jgi:hypothetical protein
MTRKRDTVQRCICTVICSNYIAYARTQYDSLRKYCQQLDYFVFVVDADIKHPFEDDEFQVIVPEQIFKVNEFKKYAFLYNALELSTNVKPRLLKHLLQSGYSQVLYLDPDICFYSDVSNVFDHFSEGSILLTPHALHPYDGDFRPNDQDFLIGGVFNLGFIGVNDSRTAEQFLDWWGQRCLGAGYNEVRSGLMVDQKWVNLAPCYFDGVAILKNAGYNVAYWNLHERRLSKVNNVWLVNDDQPLVFYHFSGVRFDQDHLISKHQNRFSMATRTDLISLFQEYHAHLIHNGISDTFYKSYRYDTFDNDKGITELARKLYYGKTEVVDGDPFNSNGEYYKWLKKNRMIGFSKANESYNSMNFNAEDGRIQVIHLGLKIFLYIFGPNTYLLLMKYLSFISIIRNQSVIYRYKKNADNNKDVKTQITQ